MEICWGINGTPEIAKGLIIAMSLMYFLYLIFYAFLLINARRHIEIHQQSHAFNRSLRFNIQYV